MENVDVETIGEGPKVPETINFSMSVDEANVVLAALQELPHKVVHSLLQKLVEQANSQVK